MNKGVYEEVKRMTKQEMRAQIQSTRKREKAEEVEKTMIDLVHERQKEILNDPSKKKWNQYHCWDFCYLDKIKEAIADGWEFRIEDGHILGFKEGCA